LQVRVCLSNMPETLLVPFGAKAGEVVNCDVPKVPPLTSAQQRWQLLEVCMMTRLKWVKVEACAQWPGGWATDEGRRERKFEAMRTLRGRRMGLVLRTICEEDILG